MVVSSYSVKLFAVILLIVCLFDCSNCHKNKEKETHPKKELHKTSREPRNGFFPFLWVTFPPSPCGSQNEGTCVQRGRCSRNYGGTVSGNCQDGFGECCIITEECNVNRTQIDVTPLVATLKSPTSTDTECSFRFRKETNICQIRLDFVDFKSEHADVEGNCATDRLRITGSITVEDFTTCGILDTQHMYLTYGSKDIIEVTPLFKASSSRYKIVATKIPCDSKNRVPDYCFQYYTKPTDMVRSFDFGEAGQQQNNQYYTVCVKPMSQSSSIQWKSCPATTNAFTIVSSFEPFDPPCTRDWVQIRGKDKICSTTGFPVTTSKWKPYELMVNFDERELPDLGSLVSQTLSINLTNNTCDATRCTIDVPIMGYDCSCQPPTDGQCTCISRENSPFPPPSSADFDNKGFCLEYSQL
ncbi:hypothetical protein Ocin01_05811 [Orchesella cincta]|uniref:CUB domain-containing protein n=1 Tax=Orchesella cincta TaxID=48709 RepID=A0A1D2N711_ORCCI|nr:hypothetical protein Ocin01_05811 [Orchesella cincta]